MTLHLANQSLKNNQNWQVLFWKPQPSKEKFPIKANKTETYIPGWFLFFVFSPLSFHFFIRVTWSRCCNHFVNSHIKQQHFLQHPPLLKCFPPALTMGVDGTEGEPWLLRTVSFCFEMGLRNQNVDFFLLWKLFPTSVPTHLYDLEASSLLIQTDIMRTLFQELAETQIMPRIGVPFHKSDFVDHYPVLEEYTYQAKNVCQCSPVGKILGFSTFLPLMLARGCSVYLEYCFWLTIRGRNCLQSAALSGGAGTASVSLPNSFLFFTRLAVLGFLLN